MSEEPKVVRDALRDPEVGWIQTVALEIVPTPTGISVGGLEPWMVEELLCAANCMTNEAQVEYLRAIATAIQKILDAGGV